MLAQGKFYCDNFLLVGALETVAEIKLIVYATIPSKVKSNSCQKTVTIFLSVPQLFVLIMYLNN